VLAAKVSAREATVAWDSATFRVKDVEDWIALAEKEALERVSKAEAENATVLASASKDTEGLARKVTLLEDELAAEHWAQEMSQREHRACFEELTLLQTWDSVLCHAIVGPPWPKYLSEGMRLAALHHIEMAGELTMFWAVVSSAAQSVLGCSPSNTTRAVVVGELVAEFQKVEYRCSWLERPITRICNLLLGLLSGRAWLADHLNEVAGQLKVELAARWEAEAELEAI
jgi:hypothetical protein